MKILRICVIMFIALMGLSCSDSVKRVPERNYYVEIKTNQNNIFNMELATFLQANIPQYKYTITYSSGQAWPYYAALHLDETIAADSLMSPHWYLHKMIMKGSNLILKSEEHLVQIELMPQPDTIPNYQMDIFEMDSSKLMLTATTGVHFVDTTQFPTRQSLFDYYLKSIIRYSFK